MHVLLTDFILRLPQRSAKRVNGRLGGFEEGRVQKELPTVVSSV